MSSTAILVKLMTERLEMDSEHGKRVMGVLLFQDLAVVPLLVLIPALGASDENLFMALAIAGLKAAALIAVLLVGGQRVMRAWLTLVARRKSDELFILNLLLITLGLAWLTELAGLSLALGAFIAGMLISETEFKHQVETDIRPFHDVLLGLFFITIGMMLNWRLVWDRWPLVLLLVVVPVLFKLVLVTGAGARLGCNDWCFLAHGYLFGAGGRVWFCAAHLGAAKRIGTACFAESYFGQYGAVDVGHTVFGDVQQQNCDETGQQRLAATIVANDRNCPKGYVGK